MYSDFKTFPNLSYLLRKIKLMLIYLAKMAKIHKFCLANSLLD